MIVTLEENWSLFQSKLKQVTKTNNGIVGCCPAHKDQKPSLTASCNGEKILFRCQAGCNNEDILKAIGMEWEQFFTSFKKPNNQNRKIVERYRYENHEKKHLYDVVRFEPKDFRPQRPDSEWTLNQVKRVPYRLPQMLKAIKSGKSIFIVEGEKLKYVSPDIIYLDNELAYLRGLKVGALVVDEPMLSAIEGMYVEIKE